MKADVISEKVDHVLSVGMVRGEQMGGRKIQVRSIHGQSCWEGTWAGGGWAALQGRGSGRRPKPALNKLWFLRLKTELESGKGVLFRIPPHGLHL